MRFRGLQFFVPLCFIVIVLLNVPHLEVRVDIPKSTALPLDKSEKFFFEKIRRSPGQPLNVFSHVCQTTEGFKFTSSNFLQFYIERLLRTQRDLLEEYKIGVQENKNISLETLLIQSSEIYRILGERTKELQSCPKDGSDDTDLINLRNKVWQKIDRLQKQDCKQSITCDLNGVPYGLAMGVHTALHCMIYAFQHDKRVDLRVARWNYLKRTGWEVFFQKFSTDQCGDLGQKFDAGDGYIYHLRHEIFKVPKNVADLLLRMRRDPYVWWFGVFLSYLFKPSDHLENVISSRTKAFDIKLDNSVCLHVRRSDKIVREAARHDEEEYMRPALRAIAAHNLSKTIFVATDDPPVFTALQQKYPAIKFVGNASIAATAQHGFHRYTPKGTYGVLSDIFMLSRCHTMIGTFSSGVSKIEYEIKTALSNKEEYGNVFSLDSRFYYTFIALPPQLVIYGDQGEELNITAGDLLSMNHQTTYDAGKRMHWYNSHSVGFILDKNGVNDLDYSKPKKYPLYKTVDTMDIDPDWIFEY